MSRGCEVQSQDTCKQARGLSTHRVTGFSTMKSRLQRRVSTAHVGTKLSKSPQARDHLDDTLSATRAVRGNDRRCEIVRFHRTHHRWRSSKTWHTRFYQKTEESFTGRLQRRGGKCAAHPALELSDRKQQVFPLPIIVVSTYSHTQDRSRRSHTIAGLGCWGCFG